MNHVQFIGDRYGDLLGEATVATVPAVGDMVAGLPRFGGRVKSRAFNVKDDRWTVVIADV
jgi:hypothetical protein